MKDFSQPGADLYVPDASPMPKAVERTTHLGVGAHADDLEFMALHGILACYQRGDCWFGGVTCTDGGGSARKGPFAGMSDLEMMAIRREEQRSAARLGGYGFMAQLSHPSTHVKGGEQREHLVEDLVTVLELARPRVIYTHNPFDKHATHIGVLAATLAAIHRLPLEDRPERLIGCEVWRGLDWLPDRLKVVHDVSGHPDLATALSEVFASQIGGGKCYDKAVAGRRRANATFLDSHAVDGPCRVDYAVDLSGLISGGDLKTFVEACLESFSAEIRNGLGRSETG